MYHCQICSKWKGWPTVIIAVRLRHQPYSSSYYIPVIFRNFSVSLFDVSEFYCIDIPFSTDQLLMCCILHFS